MRYLGQLGVLLQSVTLQMAMHMLSLTVRALLLRLVFVRRRLVGLVSAVEQKMASDAGKITTGKKLPWGGR